MSGRVGHERFGWLNRRGGLIARRRLDQRRWLNRRGSFQAFGHLSGCQRTEQPEQVRDAFHAAHPSVRGEALQFPLGGFNDLGVQKLAQLNTAQELIEQG
ncbi:hypothetical protein FQZ97_1150450 [compost metagenome]